VRAQSQARKSDEALFAATAVVGVRALRTQGWDQMSSLEGGSVLRHTVLGPSSDVARLSYCLACFRKLRLLCTRAASISCRQYRRACYAATVGQQPPLTLGDDHMNTFARIALGLLITGASLASPKAASAFVRWQNASTPNNNLFFMGVSGGPLCGGHGCSYNSGTQIITYQFGQNDQEWNATFPGGPEHIVNMFGDIVSGTGWCLHVSGGSLSNGANLVISPCTSSSIDNWTIQSAQSLGAPWSGCFAFINQASGKAMAVQGGVPFNGAHVIQYDLCRPDNNACGNPSHAFHADQFWCPLNI